MATLVNHRVTIEFIYELIQEIILLTLVLGIRSIFMFLSLLSREIFIHMPIKYEQTRKKVSMTEVGDFSVILL